MALTPVESAYERFSRHQYNWDWRNFSPRLGFACQVTTRTVLRAGYAHVYSASFKAASGTDTPYGFRGETPWILTLDGIAPTNLLSNPFPGGLSYGKGSSEGLLGKVNIKPHIGSWVHTGACEDIIALCTWLIPSDNSLEMNSGMLGMKVPHQTTVGWIWPAFLTSNDSASRSPT